MQLNNRTEIMGL